MKFLTWLFRDWKVAWPLIPFYGLVALTGFVTTVEEFLYTNVIYHLAVTQWFGMVLAIDAIAKQLTGESYTELV